MDKEKLNTGLECCIVCAKTHVCPAGCPYAMDEGVADGLTVHCDGMLLMDAQLRIRELEAGQQWISAKDRLPDAAGYECLVCAVNENYNQTHVLTAHTGYGEPGWWTGNVNYMSGATSPRDNRLHPALNVTHWMPLPEPPKEDDDGTV